MIEGLKEGELVVLASPSKHRWQVAPRPGNDSVVFTSELSFEEHYRRLHGMWSRYGGFDARPGTAIDMILQLAAQEAVETERRVRDMVNQLMFTPDPWMMSNKAEALEAVKHYKGANARLFIGDKEVKPFDAPDGVIYEGPVDALAAARGDEDSDGNQEFSGLDEDDAADPGVGPAPDGEVALAPGLVPMSYPRLNRDVIMKTDVCYVCATGRRVLWRFVRGPKDETLTCEPCLRDHMGYEIDYTTRTLRKSADI